MDALPLSSTWLSHRENLICKTYMSRRSIVGMVVWMCLSELIFSGVLNGWAAFYEILDPKSPEAVTRVNWIYTIANMVAMVAWIPQGWVIDTWSSKVLLVSHAAIGVVGYMGMIFAAWVESQSEDMASTTAWILWIMAECGVAICSNGMHLAIMCYIPKLGAPWHPSVEVQNQAISIFYTVTNGFYAAGPLVVWVVALGTGPRGWMGIGIYAGITILLLMVVTGCLILGWEESTQWRSPQWPILHLQRSHGEFMVANSIATYFLIGFVAMVTVRSPEWTRTFSVLLPCIGLFMTLVLSWIAKVPWWSWNGWVTKWIVVLIVTYAWSLCSILASSLGVSGFWIASTVLYCIVCPIYYSVTAHYLEYLSMPETRGLLRGIVMAVGGPPLFSLTRWIGYSQKHGYGLWDMLQMGLLVGACIGMVLCLHRRHR